MSQPRTVQLTNQETGEQLEFWSMATACEFLDRSTAYVSVNLMRSGEDQCVITSKSGKPYTFKLGEKGKRRDLLAPADHEGHVHIPYEQRQKFASQLCTTCARAVGFCSWSQRLEPVEGWKAEPSVIKNHSKRDTDKETVVTEVHGYRVIECPLYIKDAATKAEQKDQRKMLLEERRKHDLQGSD